MNCGYEAQLVWNNLSAASAAGGRCDIPAVIITPAVVHSYTCIITMSPCAREPRSRLSAAAFTCCADRCTKSGRLCWRKRIALEKCDCRLLILTCCRSQSRANPCGLERAMWPRRSGLLSLIPNSDRLCRQKIV